MVNERLAVLEAKHETHEEKIKSIESGLATLTTNLQKITQEMLDIKWAIRIAVALSIPSAFASIKELILGLLK